MRKSFVLILPLACEWRVPGEPRFQECFPVEQKHSSYVEVLDRDVMGGTLYM